MNYLFNYNEPTPLCKIMGKNKSDKGDIDITNKIKTFYCDQRNPEIIKKMWDEPELQEQFDIIIDDGLHKFDANVCFFENNIHKLKQNGFFIIEDILLNEEKLFKDKIKEWEDIYIGYLFTLIKIPSSRNPFDNNLLVVFKP